MTIKKYKNKFRIELLAQLITGISGGILIWILTQLIDASELGIFFSVLSIFAILKVFTKFGIYRSASRYISEYRGRDRSQLKHIISTSFIFQLVSISVVSIFLLFTYQQISNIFGDQRLAPLLLLGPVYLFALTYTKYVRVILQGFEEIKQASVVLITERVLRLILAVLLVILGFGAIGALWGYILSHMFASVIGLLIIYLLTYRSLPSAPIEQGLRKRIAKYSIPLTITSSANAIDKRIDDLLILLFLGSTSVSIYVVGKQIIEFLEKPMIALGFSLVPSFGSKKAEGKIKDARRLYQSALIGSLTIYIPAAVGLVILAEQVMLLIFGEEYLATAPVLQVLAVYSIFLAIDKITSHGLDYLGRARTRAILKSVTSIFNFCLNLLLIPTIGVVGAAVATVISHSIYTLGNISIIHSEFDLDLTHLLKKLLLIITVAFLMAIAVILFTNQVSGFFQIVGGIFVGIIVWFVLSIFFDLIDPNELPI